jgi:hypothetical protein
VAGVVRETRGRFNPRAFSVTLGSGTGHGVALYRSPAGTRWSTAGGIYGTLRLDPAGTPVPWGLLELEVELSETATLTFRAQADRNGDFALALNRLPPLPQGVDSYSAQLSVSADAGASPATPADPGLLPDALTGSLGANTFEEQIELEIHPGEVRRVNSFERNHLAVKATE